MAGAARGPGEVLLVDDDRSLLDVLAMALEDAGLAVRTASDGRAGWEAFLAAEPDLVVLDLLMPGLDGLELCRRVRARSAVPVIMLTSRGEEMDRVLGLETGADDYVTKPFSTRELVARIRAALRRVRLDRPEGAPDAVVVRGPLRLDRSRREVRVRGALVPLTATEFELLHCLASRPGHVFDRDSLIDAVYGEGFALAPRTMDTFVKRLRQKLGGGGLDPEAIETVRGVGYRLREDLGGGAEGD